VPVAETVHSSSLSVPRAPVFCWSYLSKSKGIAAECKRCDVYKLGVYRCYEIANLGQLDGRLKVACPTTCDQCDYYDWVRSQPAQAAAPENLMWAELSSLYRGMDERLRAVEGLVRGSPGAARVDGPAGNPTLSGKVAQGLIADVLQLISGNVMSGVFRISQDGSHIKVHFRDGEIVHAEGEGLQGESAFFAAMAMEHGEFLFLETTEEVAQRTIEGKAQFLILEALRQIDEKNGEG
jgi:hypothetical protein